MFAIKAQSDGKYLKIPIQTSILGWWHNGCLYIREWRTKSWQILFHFLLVSLIENEETWKYTIQIEVEGVRYFGFMNNEDLEK